MSVRWIGYRIILGAGLLVSVIGIGDTVRLTMQSPETPSVIPESSKMISREDPRPESPALTRLFALPDRPPNTGDAGSGKSWISRRYHLELKGTVAGEMAVVTDLETRREHIVSMGESMDGYRVEEIGRNRLVISGTEGRETLILPSESDPASSAAEDPDAVRVIERKTLSELLGSVDKLAAEISLKPVREAEGGLAGYRITALKPRGTLAGMGLRKNDLLKTINGQQIRTPEDVYRVLESTVHDNNLTVTIRRSSSDLQYHYQIR